MSDWSLPENDGFFIAFRSLDSDGDPDSRRAPLGFLAEDTVEHEPGYYILRTSNGKGFRGAFAGSY